MDEAVAPMLSIALPINRSRVQRIEPDGKIVEKPALSAEEEFAEKVKQVNFHESRTREKRILDDTPAPATEQHPWMGVIQQLKYVQGEVEQMRRVLDLMLMDDPNITRLTAANVAQSYDASVEPVLKLSLKKKQLTEVSELLTHSAARLTSVLDSEAVYFGELRTLRASWRLRAHGGGIAADVAWRKGGIDTTPADVVPLTRGPGGTIQVDPNHPGAKCMEGAIWTGGRRVARTENVPLSPEAPLDTVLHALLVSSLQRAVFNQLSREATLGQDVIVTENTLRYNRGTPCHSLVVSLRDAATVDGAYLDRSEDAISAVITLQAIALESDSKAATPRKWTDRFLSAAYQPVWQTLACSILDSVLPAFPEAMRRVDELRIIVQRRGKTVLTLLLNPNGRLTSNNAGCDMDLTFDELRSYATAMLERTSIESS